ncbi:hypothetical protein L486_06009 [Kwoniella mangroviensis CBS 10435]|uniref:Uncharacterized protein n=1 Tax=Kwoniella mangroviensis CBS 10435 TaxID=1331196 RepID=A0A1B9IK70_9TREE|nr:hypothetical protein L486_06009 [Kwoniella mangroviensis CBS 10435]OCF78818.1 hypothetical protein I204_00762 [Kwoniella mangroviensis CBS 8886]
MSGVSTTYPLHRIRFYDHTPSPITALSFAPLPLPPPRGPAASSSKGKSRDGQQQHTNHKDEFGVLILARENGEVEVWEYVRDEEGNISGNWVLKKTLPPTLTHPTVSSIALVIRDPLNFHRKSYSVPKLEDLRLFTAGSDSNDITERCLITGRILQTYDIPSPPLWTLSVAPTQDLLCLSSSSSTLHFLSIPPPTMFNKSPALEPPPSELLRCDTLPSRTRTVSIAWGVPKLVKSSDTVTNPEIEGEYEWRNTYLITGNSDSSLRKWELPPPGGKKAGTPAGNQRGTIVWGVGVLPDHNFVTSDSLGNVTFWDGQSMAQQQHFRAHKADGMCLTIGPGGRSVFTSGPDQRICQFVNVPSTSGSGSQWVLTTTKRVHSHDVRALAVFPPYTPFSGTNINPGYAPVIASGGWDMSLTFTSAGAPDFGSSLLMKNLLGKPKGASGSRVTFEESFSRKMGYMTDGRVQFAPQARLLLGRKDRSVGVWKVLEDEQGWEKVLEMELKLRTNLTSSSISPNGKWLAVSDLYETKLFQLSSQGNAIRPSRIKSFLSTLTSSTQLEHLSIRSKGCGSSSISFTNDSQRLILGLVSSGQLLVLELPQDANEDEIEVVKCFTREDKIVDGRVVKPKPNGTIKVNGDVDMETNGHEQSEESEESEESDDDDEEGFDGGSKKEENADWISCLAVSDDNQWLAAGDMEGRVGIWNLDTLQLHATLPTLPYPPTSLSFPPSSSPILILASPTNTFQLYNLEQRKLLVPSPTGQLNELHRSLASLHTPLSGLTFAHGQGGKPGKVKMLIWGIDWMVTCHLNLDEIINVKNRRSSISIAVNGSPAGGRGGSKKKRAREAKLARDHLDTPSVAEEGEGEMEIKVIRDRFKSILAIGWLGQGQGQGELGVVERPFGDFAGELPNAFWSGGYGRS